MTVEPTLHVNRITESCKKPVALTPRKFFAKVKRWLSEANYHKCIRCKLWFEKKRHPGGQLVKYCKPCNVARMDQWRQDNPEAYKRIKQKARSSDRYKQYQKDYGKRPEVHQRILDYKRKKKGSMIPLGTPALTKTKVATYAQSFVRKNKKTL